MARATSWLLLACVQGLGGAAHGPQRIVFDLERIAPDGASTPAPASAFAAARHLVGPHGPPLEPPAAQNLRRSASYKCALHNFDNVQYHLSILIGTPCSGGASRRQRFRVVPDTGSADLWVPASNCTHCIAHSTNFNIVASCSARMIGDRITFRYGDGTVAHGGSFEDDVRVGALEVSRQFMIQVDRVSHNSHMKSDGILGLAHHYEQDQLNRGRTFMARVFQGHPGLPKMFSFFLTGNAEGGSQLVFGHPKLEDHAKEGEFRYGKSYWMQNTGLWLTSIWSLGFAETGTEVSFPEHGTVGCPTMIDTGTSLMVLEVGVFDRLIPEITWRMPSCRYLDKQKMMECDCPPGGDLSRLPSLVINAIDANDQQFALCMAPEEYILASISPITGRDTCVPAFQKGGHRQPVPLIFGMTFLRSFYTNFDIANKRIGFARSRASPLPGGSTCATDARPTLRRTIWLSSMVLAIMSLLYVLFVTLAPKGCCSRRCGCCCPGMRLASAPKVSKIYC